VKQSRAWYKQAWLTRGHDHRHRFCRQVE